MRRNLWSLAAWPAPRLGLISATEPLYTSAPSLNRPPTRSHSTRVFTNHTHESISASSMIHQVLRCVHCLHPGYFFLSFAVCIHSGLGLLSAAFPPLCPQLRASSTPRAITCSSLKNGGVFICIPGSFSVLDPAPSRSSLPSIASFSSGFFSFPVPSIVSLPHVAALPRLLDSS
ncbi:hypothetical protein FB45DRAFT_941185 [Roridomyces roridus]|uniref:Uncharacterized protein n=1 Tax=Roridomyces roridus TaxID=1738132 RepID=A0AAD7B688_9AGAR|nr:hypothetical protein FB45DRAFT_941185 [Roridomyces roridus]